MSNIKLPLIFSLDEDDDCCAWKNDVEAWQAFNKEEPEWHRPAVYLLLNGRARKTVRGISITKLMKGNGVEEIIKILDEIFQIEEAARAYHAFKDYVEHRAEIRIFHFW